MSEELRKQEPEAEQQLVVEISEPKIETEFSPEAIEGIMEKVQDINTKGIAYSRIGHVEHVDTMRNTLKFGIMGGVARQREGGSEGQPYSAKEWKKVIKDKGKDKFVHFNIVGRSLSGHGENKTAEAGMGESHWLHRSGAVALMFDISDFQELPPLKYMGEGGNQKKNTFRSNQPELAAAWKKMEKKFPNLQLGDDCIKNYEPYSTHMFGWFDEDGLPLPDSECGFILSPRVPPRRFTGIAIEGSLNDQEINNWTSQISKLIVDTYGNDDKKYFPIYNMEGHLLWPKQMSYEEVKRFIAERDKSKEENQ